MSSNPLKYKHVTKFNQAQVSTLMLSANWSLPWRSTSSESTLPELHTDEAEEDGARWPVPELQDDRVTTDEAPVALLCWESLRKAPQESWIALGNKWQKLINKSKKDEK